MIHIAPEVRYTTLLTYNQSHISLFLTSRTCPPVEPGYTYLKEPLKPPDLEHALPNQNSQLEYTPPLDPAICAFRCIAVSALADNDVGLFIFDLIQELGELFNYVPHTQ